MAHTDDQKLDERLSNNQSSALIASSGSVAVSTL